MDELESHSPLSVPRDLKFLAVRNLYVLHIVKKVLCQKVQMVPAALDLNRYMLFWLEYKYLNFLKEKI